MLKKNMPKKSVASKQPRGLSSKYDRSRFVSADSDARFHDFVTWRSRIKDRGFDIDVENARVEDFQIVIQSRGSQLFCKHPKAAAMTVVREFFANAAESTLAYMVFARGKHVRYDVGTINQLLRLPYNPSGPDELDYLMNSAANMMEVSNEICKKGRGVLSGL